MTVHRLEAGQQPVKVISRGTSGELYLYGTIGEDFFGGSVTAKFVADEIKKLSSATTINVRINSEGGDVFAGKAMYSLLHQHKARVIVHVDGIAASAASFIAMAGDEIVMSEGAFMMVHDAYGTERGRAKDHRAFADLLDVTNASIVDVYAARTKNDREKIKKWMDAETWFTGKEAVANGFADRVVENLKVAASVSDPSTFRNLPVALQPRRQRAAVLLSEMAAMIRR